MGRPFALLGAVLLFASSAGAQDLPRQVGAINDYAAALGGDPQREPLRAAIQQLAERQGVSLVILLSERDPFNDLPRYAAEIRRAWGLPTQRSAFALFLKEARRWFFELWLSEDLVADLNPAGLERLRKQVTALSRRGRLREASLSLSQGLLALLARADTPLALEAEGPSWLQVLGAIGVGVLFVGLVWRRVSAFCPRCHARLARGTRRGRQLRYCPRCGYNRPLERIRGSQRGVPR